MEAPKIEQSNLEIVEQEKPTNHTSIALLQEDLDFIRLFQKEENLSSETEALSFLLNIARKQLECLPQYKGKSYREQQKEDRENHVLNAIQAIMDYNDRTPEPRDRFKITLRLLMEVTNSRHSIIKRVMEKYKQSIDDHHHKYNFPYMQNRDNTHDPKELIEF